MEVHKRRREKGGVSLIWWALLTVDTCQMSSCVTPNKSLKLSEPGCPICTRLSSLGCNEVK